MSFLAPLSVVFERTDAFCLDRIYSLTRLLASSSFSSLSSNGAVASVLLSAEVAFGRMPSVQCLCIFFCFSLSDFFRFSIFLIFV
jgi:hypothetical protein